MTALDITPTSRPEVLYSGTFSVYNTPDGGYHLVYRLAGEDNDRHFPVPAYLVKMGEQVAAGKKLNLLQLLKRGK